LRSTKPCLRIAGQQGQGSVANLSSLSCDRPQPVCRSFYLTHLPLDELRKISKGRIINLCSSNYLGGKFDVRNMQGEKLRRLFELQAKPAPLGDSLTSKKRLAESARKACSHVRRPGAAPGSPRYHGNARQLCDGAYAAPPG
jgi:hypothetical protein